LARSRNQTRKARDHELQCLPRSLPQEALDLVITKGTTHDWAAIREESVLTIERMTGKTWYQNGENERAEWHAKDIREWWRKNKAIFQFPARTMQ